MGGSIYYNLHCIWGCSSWPNYKKMKPSLTEFRGKKRSSVLNSLDVETRCTKNVTEVNFAVRNQAKMRFGGSSDFTCCLIWSCSSAGIYISERLLLFDVRNGTDSACCVMLAWNNYQYFMLETLADWLTMLKRTPTGHPFPVQEQMARYYWTKRV